MSNISPALQHNQNNPQPQQQPSPPQEVSPPPQPNPFTGGEVNPEAGQYFADEARAKASIPTESKTFKVTWPAEMGATWMTCKNLEQIIKNCCPGAQFKVSE